MIRFRPRSVPELLSAMGFILALMANPGNAQITDRFESTTSIYSFNRINVNFSHSPSGYSIYTDPLNQSVPGLLILPWGSLGSSYACYEITTVGGADTRIFTHPEFGLPARKISNDNGTSKSSFFRMYQKSGAPGIVVAPANPSLNTIDFQLTIAMLKPLEEVYNPAGCRIPGKPYVEAVEAMQPPIILDPN